MDTYKIEAGAIVTTYKAGSKEEALNKYAIDAGYRSYDHLVKEHGRVDRINRVDEP